MSALGRRDVDSGTERCLLGNVYMSDGRTKIILCWPGLDSISARGRMDSDLTWNKHVENIVPKAGKRLYMLYQLKRARIGQHDPVIIYVSVIRPVLEYACPVWHTNLNKHLTESTETVQKRALKCIYPGNE